MMLFPEEKMYEILERLQKEHRSEWDEEALRPDYGYCTHELNDVFRKGDRLEATVKILVSDRETEYDDFGYQSNEVRYYAILSGLTYDTNWGDEDKGFITFEWEKQALGLGVFEELECED